MHWTQGLSTKHSNRMNSKNVEPDMPFMKEIQRTMLSAKSNMCRMMSSNKKVIASVSLTLFFFILLTFAWYSSESVGSGWSTSAVKHCFGTDQLSDEALRHTNQDMITEYQCMRDVMKPYVNKMESSSSYGQYFDRFEHRWARHFDTLLDDEHIHSLEWTKTFGPFTPLILPWLDINRNHVLSGQPADIWRPQLCLLLLDLFTNLNSDYLYVTVIQHDQGLSHLVTRAKPDCGPEFYTRWIDDWKNQVLQLSLGGYGHVPIPLISPLFKSNEKMKERRKHIFDDDKLGHLLRDGTTNEYLLGNSGSDWDIRGPFNKAMKETALALQYQNITDQKLYAGHYKGVIGRETDSDLWELFGWGCCKYIVTMRGRGPTTFSYFETMALGGALPIYVWSGVKWMPYRPIWDKFATIVEWKPKCKDTIDDIIDLATTSLRHKAGRESDYEIKMKWIQKHFDEYFTFEGMVQQIKWFLADGPVEMVPTSRSRLHCEGTADIKNDAHHKRECHMDLKISEWI